MSEVPARAPNERRRLESLRRLGVLDGPPRDELSDVARLVARLLGAQYAAITFVDAEESWTLAVAGATELEPSFTVARSASPAAAAITAEEGLASIDLQDPSFGAHPAPQEQPLRRAVADVIRSPDGQPVGAIEVAWAEDRGLDPRGHGVLRRLSEHVARILELHGEADEYRRFIELSPDAVAVLDLDGHVELANPALRELLDLDDADQLLGRPFLELVAEDDRARVATELARVLFGRRRTTQLDMGLQCGDGRVLLCSVTAGHLRASRRSLQLSIRDLDDRIRAEEERARLSEQLAQAQRLDLAGQLASGLAHDLNNLLVIMTSNLDLAVETARRVEKGEEEPRPLLEDLDQLRIAVDRAGELTTKLMRFARREPRSDRVADLAETAEGVDRLVAASLSDDVRLRIELEDGLPPLAVDPGQLEQALVNLVFNAGDAMPDGGTITVRAVRIAPDMRVAAASRSLPGEDEHVYIEVSDDGVGMDEETRTRAFEPLFSTKGGGKGSGLGLPTVLAFAHEVGGAIDLTSQPEEGTTVSMLLPVAATEVEAPEADGDGRSAVGGARVLLVDPGEQARRVITRMLEGAGYGVTPVASKGEAVEAMQEHDVDVVVTELVLPDGSGWRLVEQARLARPDLPALLFVASEATADLEGVRTLVKPFSHERLLRTLGELLRSRA